MKLRALWQELVVDTTGFHKQNPPLMKVAAATIVGLEAALVRMELHRLGVEVLNCNVDAEGVPFVTLQHLDDDQMVWETTVDFPQMKGHHVWSHTVDKHQLKITFVKEAAA